MKFTYRHYFDFKDEDDGSKNVRKLNLFSTHFQRLKQYNKDWKVQKIHLYEYFLICARKYGHKNFTQKMSMIKRATRLSKDSIIKYTAELENANFISVERNEKRGIKKLNRYTIHYTQIKNSLEDIYNLSGLSKDELEGCKQMLSRWYDYHASKSYRDSNAKDGNGDNRPYDNSQSENPTSIGYNESLDKEKRNESQE